MTDTGEQIARLAHEHDFSGVVRLDRGEDVLFEEAYGLADRAHAIPNTVETRFGLASGTKGFTALTVVSLIEEGHLEFGTTARSVLGDDLPLIRDDVTVEHLLAHRSGIGDYIDEDDDALDLDDHLLPVPVHELSSTESYLTVLDGYPTKSPPGQRFSYSNSGYVVLALIAERVSGTPFEHLVVERVCVPAGAARTDFLRSDELPSDVARGYLAPEGLRSNVFHLPVLGSGDGGIYSTVGDVHGLWRSLFAGRVVSEDAVAAMVAHRSDAPAEAMRYGMGFWLDPAGPAVILGGADAGVSFRTVHDPVDGVTHTVVSNTTDGAWPVARYLRDQSMGRRPR